MNHVEKLVKDLLAIAKGITIKRGHLASKFEDIYIIRDADYYILATKGLDTFDTYITYEKEIMLQAGMNTEQVAAGYLSKTNIPEEFRPIVFQLKHDKVLAEYTEKNDYYRTLMGLRPLADLENVYLEYEVSGVNFRTPVHLMTDYEISILEQTGEMDKIIERYPDKKYLKHRGARKIDLILAREARDYDIIQIGQVDNAYHRDMFLKTYEFAKRFILNSDMYQPEVYGGQSEYESYIGFLILSKTISLCLDNNIDILTQKKYTDEATIKYILQSYALDIFDDIPVRFRKLVADNIETLVHHRGTDQVFNDVYKIFGFDDVEIFKYYIVKKYNKFIGEESTDNGIQAPPPGPSISELTDISVLVTGINNTEVRLEHPDGSSTVWYDSPHRFTDLIEDSEYKVYSRYPKKPGFKASISSNPTLFKTMLYIIPGPRTLVFGDMDAGFFGEVDGEELMSRDELLDACGLSDIEDFETPLMTDTNGTSYEYVTRNTRISGLPYSNYYYETFSVPRIPHKSPFWRKELNKWLKFAWKGKIVFRPKYPVLFNPVISELEDAGVMGNQDKYIIHNGMTYKVDLFELGEIEPLARSIITQVAFDDYGYGRNEGDPISTAKLIDPRTSDNFISKLLYPICEDSRNYERFNEDAPYPGPYERIEDYYNGKTVIVSREFVEYNKYAYAEIKVNYIDDDGSMVSKIVYTFDGRNEPSIGPIDPKDGQLNIDVSFGKNNSIILFYIISQNGPYANLFIPLNIRILYFNNDKYDEIINIVSHYDTIASYATSSGAPYFYPSPQILSKNDNRTHFLLRFSGMFYSNLTLKTKLPIFKINDDGSLVIKPIELPGGEFVSIDSENNSILFLPNKTNSPTERLVLVSPKTITNSVLSNIYYIDMDEEDNFSTELSTNIFSVSGLRMAYLSMGVYDTGSTVMLNVYGSIYNSIFPMYVPLYNEYVISFNLGPDAQLLPTMNKYSVGYAGMNVPEIGGIDRGPSITPIINDIVFDKYNKNIAYGRYSDESSDTGNIIKFNVSYDFEFDNTIPHFIDGEIFIEPGTFMLNDLLAPTQSSYASMGVIKILDQLDENTLLISVRRRYNKSFDMLYLFDIAKRIPTRIYPNRIPMYPVNNGVLYDRKDLCIGRSIYNTDVSGPSYHEALPTSFNVSKTGFALYENPSKQYNNDFLTVLDFTTMLDKIYMGELTKSKFFDSNIPYVMYPTADRYLNELPSSYYTNVDMPDYAYITYGGIDIDIYSRTPSLLAFNLALNYTNANISIILDMDRDTCIAQDYGAYASPFTNVFCSTWTPILVVDPIEHPKMVDDTTDAPGPKRLISGNMSAGFFGEVSDSELFTNQELESKIAAYRETTTRTGWLKFAWNNKIIFKKKGPIITNMSFRHLERNGLLDSSFYVSKNGNQYRVGTLDYLNYPFSVEDILKNEYSTLKDGIDYRNVIYTHAVDETVLYSRNMWDELIIPIIETTNIQSDKWLHGLGSGSSGLYKPSDIFDVHETDMLDIVPEYNSRLIVHERKYYTPHRSINSKKYEMSLATDILANKMHANYLNWSPVLFYEGAGTFESSPILYDDNDMLPGPKYLIAGTRDYGFFGEVEGIDFVDANDVLVHAGLDESMSDRGTILNETVWLKFMYSGRVYYIPKYPILVDCDLYNLYQTSLFTKSHRQYHDSQYNGSGAEFMLSDKYIDHTLFEHAVGQEKSFFISTLPEYSVDTFYTTQSPWTSLMYPIFEDAYRKPIELEKYGDVGYFSSWNPINMINPVWEHELGSGDGCYTATDLRYVDGDDKYGVVLSTNSDDLRWSSEGLVARSVSIIGTVGGELGPILATSPELPGFTPTNILANFVPNMTIMPVLIHFKDPMMDYYDFDFSTGTILKYYPAGKNGRLQRYDAVAIPLKIYNTTVEHIGPEAFTAKDGSGLYVGLGIIDVFIPETVKTIGDNAFRNNPFDDRAVRLPHALESIGAYAFANTPGNQLVNKCIRYVVTNQRLLSIGEGAFMNNNMHIFTTSITLTSIGERAFAGCKNLKRFRLYGKTITTLNPSWFIDTQLDNFELNVMDQPTPPFIFENPGSHPDDHKISELVSFINNDLAADSILRYKMVDGSWVMNIDERVFEAIVDIRISAASDTMTNNNHYPKYIELCTNSSSQDTVTPDIFVDWGDGVIDHVTSRTYGASSNDILKSHVYDVEKIYHIKIYGQEMPAIWISSFGESIFDIIEWGDILNNYSTQSSSNLNGCCNVRISAIIPPTLTNSRRLSNLFANTTIERIPYLGDWDTALITTMNNMFGRAWFFNEPSISNLQTVSVADFHSMFQKAHNFNQPINDWLLNAATSVNYMFDRAIRFNQPLNNWRFPNLTSTSNMFMFAISFNQDLSSWEFENITNVTSMFTGAFSFNSPLWITWGNTKMRIAEQLFDMAVSFNQPVNWPTGYISYSKYMFRWALKFNQPINMQTINVGGSNGSGMFWGAAAFNQPVTFINSTTIGDFSRTFMNAKSFNQLVNTIPTSNMTNWMYTFFSAVRFNRPVPWVSTKVTNMSDMFRFARDFNSPIGINGLGFETFQTSTTYLNGMFENAISFNQPLTNMNIMKNGSAKPVVSRMFRNAKAFNQDLRTWLMYNNSPPNLDQMFEGAESFNYDIYMWRTNIHAARNMFKNAKAFNKNLFNGPLTAPYTTQYLYLDTVSGMFSPADIFVGTSITSAQYESFIRYMYSRVVDNPRLAGSKLKIDKPIGYDRDVILYIDILRKKYGWQIQVDEIVESDAFQILVNPQHTGQLSGSPSYSSGAGKFRFPLQPDGVYDFTIEWGDGTSNHITSYNDPNLLHTYPGGTTLALIKVTGICKNFTFTDISERIKLIGILNWGCIEFTDTIAGFCHYTPNLKYVYTTDGPNLSNVTTISSMFTSCARVELFGGLEHWDVSNIQDFSYAFSNLTGDQFSGSPNYEIQNFNVENWDMSNAVNLAGMFDNTICKPNVTNWDVSNVTDMSSLFSNNKYFDSDVTNWNTSKVTSISGMFEGCRLFNQDISGWDVSNVEYFYSLFEGCSSFNQDISGWDVSKGVDFSCMFWDATSFNQDISGWDVSNSTTFYGMFQGAIKFNQDISQWDTRNGTDFDNMFDGAKSFNQDISYKPDTGAWDVSKSVYFSDFVLNTSMTSEQYGKFLLGLKALDAINPLQPNLELGFNCMPPNVAEVIAARTFLTTPVEMGGKNWVIFDGLSQT